MVAMLFIVYNTFEFKVFVASILVGPSVGLGYGLLEIVRAALLIIHCFHQSPNTPQLDPAWCQLKENTLVSTGVFFDPDQLSQLNFWAQEARQKLASWSNSRVDLLDPSCLFF